MKGVQTTVEADSTTDRKNGKYDFSILFGEFKMIGSSWGLLASRLFKNTAKKKKKNRSL